MWILYQRAHFGPRSDSASNFDDGGTLLDAIHADDTYLPYEGPRAGSDLDFSFDLDLDELVVLLAIFAVVASALIASIYLVVTAPVLLAELFLDGVLSAALLQRLRKVDRRHWLESAILRSVFPVFWLALVFFIAGGFFESYVPEAVSFGEVWQHLTR